MSFFKRLSCFLLGHVSTQVQTGDNPESGLTLGYYERLPPKPTEPFEDIRRPCLHCQELSADHGLGGTCLFAAKQVYTPDPSWKADYMVMSVGAGAQEARQRGVLARYAIDTCSRCHALYGLPVTYAR